jgi:hypothetical protein
MKDFKRIDQWSEHDLRIVVWEIRHGWMPAGKSALKRLEDELYLRTGERVA